MFIPWKTITNLNHLHVDPRLSSAEEWKPEAKWGNKNGSLLHD